MLLDAQLMTVYTFKITYIVHTIQVPNSFIIVKTERIL